LFRLDNGDIFERARLTFAHEAVGIERSGKIKSVQPVSRLDDIEHAQNSTRLTGMRELDLHSLEERLLFELRDQSSSIDAQFAAYDLSVRSETNIFDVDETEFQTHGRSLSFIGTGG